MIMIFYMFFGEKLCLKSDFQVGIINNCMLKYYCVKNFYYFYLNLKMIVNVFFFEDVIKKEL